MTARVRNRKVASYCDGGGGHPASGLWFSAKVQLSSHSRKAAIPTPEQRVAERCRSQEMSVNPTDAAAHQAAALNKCQHLIIPNCWDVWQPAQQRQHFRASPQGTAGQLADDERVAFDFTSIEECAKHGVGSPEMLHPDRGINQHGYELCEGGCAGVGFGAGLGRCPLTLPTAWHFPEQSRLPAPPARPPSSRQCR